MKNTILKSSLLITLCAFTKFAYSQDVPLIPVTLFDIYTFKDVQGYIDTTGNMAIEPKFDEAYRFSEGLALVKVEGKYGFINPKGEMVIQPIYDRAWDFHEGLSTVSVNSKLGFIDKTGKIVIAPSFTNTGFFSNGLVSVKIGDKYGFIDQTGKMVITPTYNLVRGFSEGLAAVKLPGGGLWGSWGFIDKTGAMVIKPQFFGWQISDITDFKDGLAIVQKDDEDRVTYWYVINKKGEIVMNTKAKFKQYSEMRNFSEGFAVFEGGSFPGYIDKSGNILKPSFKIKDPYLGFETSSPSKIGDFHEGIAYVKVHDKWGFIYPNGNFAYDPKFEDVLSYGYYAKGIVTFKLDGKWCHRNKNKLIFDGRNAKWDSKAHVMTK
jgi:hypothetical protein